MLFSLMRCMTPAASECVLADVAWRHSGLVSNPFSDSSTVGSAIIGAGGVVAAVARGIVTKGTAGGRVAAAVSGGGAVAATGCVVVAVSGGGAPTVAHRLHVAGHQ